MARENQQAPAPERVMAAAAESAQPPSRKRARSPEKRQLSKDMAQWEADWFSAAIGKDENKLKELESRKAELVDRIRKLGGLQRVANRFFADGVELQPGERWRFQEPKGEWRSGAVGRYAATLDLDDGVSVRLLDVPEGTAMRRAE